MPCPYAERRGALVLCKVKGKTVNPIAYPCLGTKYEACPYYRQAQQAKPREEKAEKPGPRPSPPREARPKPQPARAAQEARQRGLLGLTRLGGLPSTCEECVFYVKARAWCLVLGARVESPGAPPCAG